MLKAFTNERSNKKEAVHQFCSRYHHEDLQSQQRSMRFVYWIPNGWHIVSSFPYCSTFSAILNWSRIFGLTSSYGKERKK